MAAHEWRKLAYSLNLSTTTVNNIELSSHFQVEIACEKALYEWMSTATRQPLIWWTLIQALQDSDLNTLATDLDLALREGTD